jgi:peptidoglycan/xylan/chitin deacetylase (PgdA/CDA1 family)
MLRHSLRHTIKIVVAHTLYYLGLLQLWQSIVTRRKAVVLMYHRVLSSEERRRTASHPGIVVDRDTFARQMHVLKRRFVVLSVDEFAARMQRRLPFDNSSCLITFDDGWRDNFTNALPILRELRLPALIFLPVSYIGRRRLFWQEMLTHLLVRVVHEVRQAPVRQDRFRALLAPVGLESVINLTDDDPRLSIIGAVGTRKMVPASVLEKLSAALAAELGVALDELDDTDSFMDWTQVAAMAQQGVAFGGHGAEHYLLTEVPADQAQADIRTSKEVIDRTFAGTVPTFSYPNGSWSPELAERVKCSGYRLAFTTNPGLVTCNDHMYTIRRVNIHEDVTDTTPMFLARIVGLF